MTGMRTVSVRGVAICLAKVWSMPQTRSTAAVGHGQARDIKPRVLVASVATPVSFSAFSAVHRAELKETWEIHPKIPSLASRKAWAEARGIDPGQVHAWFSRRKYRATKKGERVLDGEYDLPISLKDQKTSSCTGTKRKQAAVKRERSPTPTLDYPRRKRQRATPAADAGSSFISKSTQKNAGSQPSDPAMEAPAHIPHTRAHDKKAHPLCLICSGVQLPSVSRLPSSGPVLSPPSSFYSVPELSFDFPSSDFDFDGPSTPRGLEHDNDSAIVLPIDENIDDDAYTHSSAAKNQNLDYLKQMPTAHTLSEDISLPKAVTSYLPPRQRRKRITFDDKTGPKGGYGSSGSSAPLNPSVTNFGHDVPTAPEEYSHVHAKNQTKHTADRYGARHDAACSSTTDDHGTLRNSVLGSNPTSIPAVLNAETNNTRLRESSTAQGYQSGAPNTATIKTQKTNAPPMSVKREDIEEINLRSKGDNYDSDTRLQSWRKPVIVTATMEMTQKDNRRKTKGTQPTRAAQAGAPPTKTKAAKTKGKDNPPINTAHLQEGPSSSVHPSTSQVRAIACEAGQGDEAVTGLCERFESLRVGPKRRRKKTSGGTAKAAVKTEPQPMPLPVATGQPVTAKKPKKGKRQQGVTQKSQAVGQGLQKAKMQVDKMRAGHKHEDASEPEIRKYSRLPKTAGEGQWRTKAIEPIDVSIIPAQVDRRPTTPSPTANASSNIMFRNSPFRPPRPYTYSQEALAAFNEIVWIEDGFNAMELSALVKLAAGSAQDEASSKLVTRSCGAQEGTFAPPDLSHLQGLAWRNNPAVYLYTDVDMPQEVRSLFGIEEKVAIEWIEASDRVNREVGLVV
ncbi:hypothetical protein IEO21_08076 [Rhodonia placenta]|uniref:Homeobox domain-containing protein n=1 Tax=Rhodonia placenta TaxID=104341 RepID=A0A8H7TZ26_9APHY|nr:hypothetical protein IEO21_08076 [Postia placenta]